MHDDEEGGLQMNMYDICLLHARSDRMFRSAVAAQLEKSQITMMEWLLLGVVAAGSTKGVNMSSVAEELRVTLPQVTALVNKLLPQKLIKQKSAVSDRRSRLVQLTNKGQLVFDEMNELMEKSQSQIFSGITEQQLADYLSVMDKLSN